MSYWILLVLVSALAVIALALNDWEAPAPAPVCMSGFVVATLLAIMGQPTWNVEPLGIEAALIVLLGCVGFIAGCWLITNSMKVDCKNNKRAGACYIAPWWKYALVGIVLLVSIYLQYSETLQLSAEYGLKTENWAEAAKTVRYATSTMYSSDAISLNAGFSIWCRQLQKVSVAAGYVSIYLLVSCMTREGNSKERFMRALPPAVLFFLSCISVLVAGGRRDIMYFCIAGACLWGVLSIRSGVDAKRVLVRLVVIALILVPIAAVGFWMAGNIVGRKASSGIVEYISFYFGCGTPTLQALIDKGVEETVRFGQYSFYYFYAFLSKFGFVDNLGRSSIDWVFLGGHNSNVPTSFACYYFDFGLLGVLIMSFVAGLILNAIYRAARICGLPILLSLMGYMSGYIFDMARANASSIGYIVSPSRLIMACLVVVLTLFFTIGYPTLRDKVAKVSSLLRAR